MNEEGGNRDWSGMDSGKLDNSLELSMDMTEEEREKSKDLGIGYSPGEGTWELIVKYQGSLDAVRALGGVVEELIAGYAIITIPQGQVDALAAIPQIEYVEKPKRLFFQLIEPLTASCISQVQLREPYLSGKNVLLAVIDTGIDYGSNLFRNADGTTRILNLWDQVLLPDEERGFRPPEGFAQGVEFSSQQINEALAAGDQARLVLPSIDVSGHGTAVASVAAGYAEEPVFRGVATQSPLLIVRLGNTQAEGFPKTTQLMRAVTWCLRKAAGYGMPLCINLSFGNTYGAHNGTSLLERFMDNAAQIGRTAICVGSGNEGSTAGHVARTIQQGEQRTEILSVGNYESALSVQIWLSSMDVYQLVIITPEGNRVTIDAGEPAGTRKVTHDGTQLLIYVGAANPYAANKEIYVEMLPVFGNGYITPGEWRFVFTGVRTATGEYAMYLPAQEARGTQTFFLNPTPQQTYTIPSTSSAVITVGAYDSWNERYADFSGRGRYYVNSSSGLSDFGNVKPDLAAPGVNLLVMGPDDQRLTVSGTSYATPFVTGACALMMEQGIVRGVDPYCYGEKLKAYLQRGAKPIRGESTYPNDRVGWGALCLRDSLPG